MTDLKFSYTTPGGTRTTEEYSTVMDFTEAVESGNYPTENLNCKDVEGRFFENSLLDQHFETVEDLYYHCESILK